ncbi:hypothetical protein [Nocardia arthritidis]|uniref:LppI n=1 Tax=Nocardia arthritidis TaxID=228602 RepID=A0A6G9YPF6_9NOCA|nr:hypothetical protein [Nocardia arthritidis]QIS15071.1 hypothetical protein F5544_36210 [Nocardia arthritidis]
MRIAAIAAILLFVAGCAASTDHQSHDAAGAVTAESSRTSTAATTTAKAGPPKPGTPIKEFAAWVQAGTAVDAASYGTVRPSDGGPTQLQSDDRAFVSPTGKIKCTSDYQDHIRGLSCLVELKNPPQRPVDDVGHWVGGWVDFPGSELTVGSFHGDPGPFVRGDGAQLGYGSRITVHDFVCRMDTTGLYCVDPTNHAGVQLSDAGVVAFGCLRERAANKDETYGLIYGC